MSDFAWGGGGAQTKYNTIRIILHVFKRKVLYIKIDRQTMSTFRRFCDEQNGIEALHY